MRLSTIAFPPLQSLPLTPHRAIKVACFVSPHWSSTDWTRIMRYEDWDVILFPRDSHVPIQEFKTACYSSQDASTYRASTHDPKFGTIETSYLQLVSGGKQSPTLSCYISSLPPSTPFRISVHSWAPVNRPSAVIESRRKPDQKITYMFQVLVDGTRVL